MPGTAVSFDGNSLQTNTIITSSINHTNLPTKQLRTYSLAHANKSVIPLINYPDKQIRITGSLIGTGISNVESLIDTFKGYFNGKDKNLDIGYAGGTRRYIATLNGLSIDQTFGLTSARFVAEFFCTQPFGVDTATSSLLSVNGRTAATYTDTLTIDGTAPEQYPIITLVYTAITGGTDKTITISNDNAGQSLAIAGTFSSGDELTINSFDRTVIYDDGVLAPYELASVGAFPIINTYDGNPDFTYLDDFTTRTFDIDIDYSKRWL